MKADEFKTRLLAGEKFSGPISVGGYLYLGGTGITALPDNLSVGGSLYLSGTGITALPDNLSVGGYLYLGGTGIPSGVRASCYGSSAIYLGSPGDYSLFAHDDGTYSAGCKRKLSIRQCRALAKASPEGWTMEDAEAYLALVEKHEATK
jgi:hypothetical protein